MPNQVFPAVPGYNGQIYSDDCGSPTQLNLDHLEQSFQVAELLKQLGHDEASELARPVHLISGFKPSSLIEKLRQYAEQCDGPACLACINGGRLPEFVWSYHSANGVNRLVSLRLAGGHVLGILTFPAVGGVCSYPESGEEAPLYLALLNVFAGGFSKHPEYLAANALLNVAGKPESFDATNIEKTLDLMSDWAEQRPVEDIHTALTYGNRTTAIQEQQ